MTDLDQRIASALRERAEGEIDTHRLLRAAQARGRRRKLRRRAATGTALALVGVLGFVGATGTDVAGLSGRLPWAAATPAAATPAVAAPVPPRADGVSGAAQRPDLVGTDPQVLHLGVDTSQARYLGWAVYRSNQLESIRFNIGGGQPVLVEVSRSAQMINELLIDGVPLQEAVVRLTFDGAVRQFGRTGHGLVTAWQPAPGLYARASMLVGDRSVLVKAVDAIRWDEARRCVAPLRLSTLPEGAAVSACSVDVAAFPGGLRAELTLYREPSATMWVKLLYGVQIGESTTESNRVVGGRPGYLYPDGTKLELLGFPKAHLTADFGWPEKGFTEADATTVLAGVQVAKDLGDPETWD